MKKKRSLSLHPSLAIRIPGLPLDSSFSKETLAEKWNDARFREAIYVASPDLYDECEKYFSNISAEKQGRLFISLSKYYSRMNSRCTPFGLFATCSVIDWGKESSLQVADASERSSRLDMHYLCHLLKEIDNKPEVRKELRYFPNSTIYKIGDQLRYVEVVYDKGRRIYRTASVSNSEYVTELLVKARRGIHYSEILKHLLSYEVSIDEAESFVNEMIDAQVIVSEIEPAITTESTGPVCSSNIFDSLRQSILALKALDENHFNDPRRYRQIVRSLESLGAAVEENKVFQVDCVNALKTGSQLNENIQETLLDGINLLHSIFPYRENESLEKFKKEFKERYGEREMLLVSLMDAEIGIGYGMSTQKKDGDLLMNLSLPGVENEKGNGINAKDARWLRILMSAQRENAYTVNLEDKDLPELKVENKDWAPSFAVTFRLAGGNKVWIEHVGGSSAINMLSRFAHADERINRLVKEIVWIEEKKNTDIIFAEIVHLPEERTGNVLQHPVIRNYEINYLARPGVSSEYQIPVDDIYVSVRMNRIILRSGRLNKEIIPRLSNAHNFGMNSLPLYHFLCDLQSQQIHLASCFHLGSLEQHFNFLPRVEYKDCILHPATWLFSKKDYDILFDHPHGHIENFHAFMKKWKIPDLFLLIEGDNELLVDARNELMICSFLKLIEKKQIIRISEFLFDAAVSPKDSGGHCYNSQFIGIVLNENKLYEPFSEISIEQSEIVTRNFIPGSEWIYYKLYCGFSFAENFLEKIIGPLMDQWAKEEKIKKWFFIRYSDPEFHLRLRVQCKNDSVSGELIKEFGRIIQPLVDQSFIPTIQLDTYEREIERYGAEKMDLSESIFCLDSESIIGLIHSTPEQERENLRWLWGMQVIDDMLDDYHYNNERKLGFVLAQRDAYAKEFNVKDITRKQIDANWRKCKSKAEAFLQGCIEKNSILEVLKDLLNKRRISLQPLLNELQIIKDQDGNKEVFLSSHLHMMLNRLFVTSPREQEWIVYEYLCRYYSSVIARKAKAVVKRVTVT